MIILKQPWQEEDPLGTTRITYYYYCRRQALVLLDAWVSRSLVIIVVVVALSREREHLARAAWCGAAFVLFFVSSWDFLVGWFVLCRDPTTTMERLFGFSAHCWVHFVHPMVKRMNPAKTLGVAWHDNFCTNNIHCPMLVATSNNCGWLDALLSCMLLLPMARRTFLTDNCRSRKECQEKKKQRDFSLFQPTTRTGSASGWMSWFQNWEEEATRRLESKQEKLPHFGKWHCDFCWHCEWWFHDCCLLSHSKWIMMRGATNDQVSPSSADWRSSVPLVGNPSWGRPAMTKTATVRISTHFFCNHVNPSDAQLSHRMIVSHTHIIASLWQCKVCSSAECRTRRNDRSLWVLFVQIGEFLLVLFLCRQAACWSQVLLCCLQMSHTMAFLLVHEFFLNFLVKRIFKKIQSKFVLTKHSFCWNNQQKSQILLCVFQLFDLKACLEVGLFKINVKHHFLLFVCVWPCSCESIVAFHSVFSTNGFCDSHCSRWWCWASHAAAGFLVLTLSHPCSSSFLLAVVLLLGSCECHQLIWFPIFGLFVGHHRVCMPWPLISFYFLTKRTRSILVLLFANAFLSKVRTVSHYRCPVRNYFGERIWCIGVVQ